MYVRRTGVAVLSLTVATNAVLWTKLLEAAQSKLSESSGALAQLGWAIGSCAIGVFAMIVAWLVGRRTRVPPKPLITRPRDVGLGLALGAAALNFLLAAIVHRSGEPQVWGIRSESWMFGAAWYAVVLPMQVVAGFCKGRAAIPIPKRSERPRPS